MKNFNRLSNCSLVVDIKNKIESKKFNMKNKTGIKIVITDVERAVGEPPTPRSLQLLFRHFETLQKVNEEFEEFLYTVKADLKEKSSELRRVRAADSSSRRCRSYAVIQLFMLQQYEQRLDRFDFLSRQSMFKLSRMFLNGDDIDEQVSDHITIIMKMKRRMKSFLDVSEKYLVLDVTDSVTQMTELCERLEGRSPRCSGEFDVSAKNLSQGKRLTAVSCKTFSVSTSGLNKLFESKVPRGPRSRSLSYSGSENVERKTFRSVTDHLLVMSKSFTNRL